MSVLYVLLPPLARFEANVQVRQWQVRGDVMPAGRSGELAATSYFSWPGDTVPVAALLREHLAHDAGSARWLCADLANIHPDLTGARILACGGLNVSREDAETLAEVVRPWLAELGAELAIGLPSRWQLRLPDDLPVPKFDTPHEVLGDDLVHHLPAGEAGRRWRTLFNEMQMLLHDQLVNLARTKRGELPANSLWFWGEGRLPAWIKTELASVYTDAPLVAALAERAGVAVQGVKQFDADAPVTAPTLLDVQRSGDAEACVQLLFGILRRHRARDVVLHFASSERWRVRRRHRLRIWRRVK